MMIAEWPGLFDFGGKTRDVRPEDLFEEFSRPVAYTGPGHAGWSPVRLSAPVRRKAHVVGLTALVLDYDGTLSMYAAAALWGRYRGIMHTTRSHRPDRQHFRVVLPFDREVTPEAFGRLWQEAWKYSRGTIDPACGDVARFWFKPGTPRLEDFHVRRLGRKTLRPLDVLRRVGA